MQCEKGKAKYIFIHKCVVGLKTSLFLWYLVRFVFLHPCNLDFNTLSNNKALSKVAENRQY